MTRKEAKPILQNEFLEATAELACLEPTDVEEIRVVKRYIEALEVAIEALLYDKEAVVQWLKKEANLYAAAGNDYYKGMRDGLVYATYVVDKYQFRSDGKVKVGEHYE